MREAAHDISKRAPPVRLRCVDAEGGAVECNSTEALLRGVDEAAGEVGIGGGLRRLIERLLGPGDA